MLGTTRPLRLRSVPKARGGSMADEEGRSSTRRLKQKARSRRRTGSGLERLRHPSMRFVSIFPVGEGRSGRELGRLLHHRAREAHRPPHRQRRGVVFVAEGEGESLLDRRDLARARQVLRVPAGIDHDVYAHGTEAMRLSLVLPDHRGGEHVQQEIYPVGATCSARSRRRHADRARPEQPAPGPFSLEELGISQAASGAEADPDRSS
jgi:hypothetical protein